MLLELLESFGSVTCVSCFRPGIQDKVSSSSWRASLPVAICWATRLRRRSRCRREAARMALTFSDLNDVDMIKDVFNTEKTWFSWSFAVIVYWCDVFLAVFTSFVSPEHVKPMRQLVECAKYATCALRQEMNFRESEFLLKLPTINGEIQCIS